MGRLSKKMMMMALGSRIAPWVPTFTFLDKFLTADDAPITSPRTSEPGPGTLTVSDSGSVAQIIGGAICTGATATGNPLITTGAFSRDAGVGVFCDWLRTDTNGGYISIRDADSLLLKHEFRITGIIAITTPNVTNFPISAPPADFAYHRSGFVLRSSGAFYIHDNQLVWVHNDETTATVKAGLSVRASNVGFAYDSLRVATLGGRWLTEDFHTSKTATPATGTTGIMAVNAHVEFTWTPAANEVLDLMVRRTDDDNCWIIRGDQANSKVYLYQKEGGIETERGTSGGAAQTWTVGTPYRIVVMINGNIIIPCVNNVDFTYYSSASFNNTATGLKVSGFATGANLIAWPVDLASTETAYIDALFDTPINAAAWLDTPTYEASGEAVHPSVIYKEAGWNGYKYWMAMTPYPLGDSTKENPSIIASNDGNTWVVPAGLTNPISGLPAGGTFYSDTELVLSQDEATLYCLYRWSNGTDTSKVYIRSSTDGVTWSEATELLTGANTIFISPSVVWDGTQYVMWVTDSSGGAGAYKIVKRTCATINGVWSAPGDCTFVNKRLYSDLWHISVVLVGTTYYMFVGLTQPGGSTDADIYLATSTDGGAWTFDPEIVMPRGSTGAWDADRQHRCFPLHLTGETFDLFYSAKSVAGNWHIGRTTFTRSV